MITRMTGTVSRILDEEVRIQIGPFEYQVLIAEFVRRHLQTRLGQEVTLHTTQYLEGNQMGNRLIPRLIGFNHEMELDFFDLFCTVEKIGVRKALKAMNRPVRELASAIQREDVKWLTTLPGIGNASAEQIVTTLKRKVTRYVLMPVPSEGGGEATAPTTVIDGTVVETVYEAILSLGLGPQEARARIDKLIASGEKFASVEEALALVFKTG